MRCLVLIIVVTAISGCASTPKVQVGYYLPKTDVSIRVVRTVSCDTLKRPYSVLDAFVDEVHSADTAAWQPLQTSALTGRFSNSDLKLEYYPGRRLKSINSSYAGQGEAIAKSFALLILPRSGVAAFRAPKACDYLSEHGEKRILTLTYSAKLDFTPTSDGTTKTPHVLHANNSGKIEGGAVTPDDASTLHHHNLVGELGEICVNAESRGPESIPVLDGEGRVITSYSDGIALKLREPGTVSVDFYTSILDPNAGKKDCETETRKLVSKSAAYADKRGDYTIPIPRARAFGESTVDLQLEPSGALAALKFGSKSGLAGAGNALTAMADHLLPSDIQAAAQLKAEADVIANQQRLLKCRLTPAECK